MLGKTADEIIREEVESVRARRIILDQLEGGPKSGSELRESIRKDMTATLIEKKGKEQVKVEKVVVSDPKLYHNTKHLEDEGIIKSRKESKERIYELCPRAVHPVRRALSIKRPLAYVASLEQPDDQRPFILWLSKSKEFRPRNLLLFVEARTWQRQVLRSVDRFIPDGTGGKWDTEWYDIPREITSKQQGADHGNLPATYDFIRDVVIDYIPSHDIVVDMSMGTPLVQAALTRMTEEYALRGIYVEKYDVDGTVVTQVHPRESQNDFW